MPGGNGDARDSAADLRIVVIDYQSGNLRSVAKALEAVGAHPLVSENPSELDTADAVILPGVGSGPAAMQALGVTGPGRSYQEVYNRRQALPRRLPGLATLAGPNRRG